MWHSHFFYATHTDRHINNGICFFLSLSHTSGNWKQRLYASAKMHHISRVASEVESRVVLVASAGHATASSSSSSTCRNSHFESVIDTSAADFTHALFRNLNGGNWRAASLSQLLLATVREGHTLTHTHKTFLFETLR